MGHLLQSKEEVYYELAERLSKTPEGSPINDDLMEILCKLYTEREALVGSRFSMEPMTLEQAAEIAGLDPATAEETLKSMNDKGLVFRIPTKNTTYYTLAPMIIGFFEFTFMRTQSPYALREMAQLFEEYFKHPEVREEIGGKNTKLMRNLIYESILPVAVETEVLDYERATEIVKRADYGAITTCACRHKAQHLDKACGAPLDICISLGAGARRLVERGYAREASVEDMLDALRQAEEYGLVHMCDNVMNEPTYICNCCGCCCYVLTSINEHHTKPAHPSNFVPVLDAEKCVGCGQCAKKCQVHAIEMVKQAGQKHAAPSFGAFCLGCGLCAAFCPKEAIVMERRGEDALHVPPVDRADKFARMSREKGR